MHIPIGDVIETQTIILQYIHLCDMHNNMHFMQSLSPH